MKPPKAYKKEHKSMIHDIQRIDEYHWMRLTDKEKEEGRKNKKTLSVINYIDKENEYTKYKLKNTEVMQKELFDEMKGRVKKNTESIPYKFNGYWYVTRYRKGQDYPIYYRKKDAVGSKYVILIDVNKLAKGYDFYNLRFSGLSNVSSDNKLMVYAVDTIGRNNFDIHIVDIESKVALDYKISMTSGSCEWANDNKTIFYLKNNPITLLSDKVYRHTINHNPNKDQIVFSEKDKSFYNGIGKTKSGKYLVIYQSSTLTNDYHILDSNNPKGRFKRFTPRLKKHKYEIDHIENLFYIRTDMYSKNRSIMNALETDTNKNKWIDLIKHRKDVFLLDFTVFKDFLVLSEKKKDKTFIRVLDFINKDDYYLNFDEKAYDVGLSGYNIEYNTSDLRFYYETLKTPLIHYSYNMKTKKRKVIKQEKIKGNFVESDYETKRLYAQSRDGVKIPVSIVYNVKKFKKKGPLLLWGYGSYGATYDPWFSSARFSLLDRGFAFAVAHIRGSKIYGESWYENGKLLKKVNTFNDFIDVGKFVINEGYTSLGNLYAIGGSAGGLLMGAVSNMRSDLFNGIIAEVPFVDVINTMLDETIPLTTGEYDEWGNPNVKKYFDYMLSYSPYDNVEKKEYTNMLITSGFHDSAVQYWEPLKWIAKLRSFKLDNNLLLLDMDMDSGHSGTTGRFKSLKKVALNYAFLLHLSQNK